MLTTIHANLYDYPKYYDLVYGSDWKAEVDFLGACFARHADGKVKRVFEPACGTGRLLVKLAQAGYQVGGVDLNEKAIAFCNARLERAGFRPTAFVGDMCDFTVPKPVDAAFNTINSFRHLASERQAEAHLQAVAQALRPGGIYVLGLHLTPTQGEPIQDEAWSARRGNLVVNSRLWVTNLDRKARREEVCTLFDVYTPTKQFRIEDRVVFRTYSARQMRALLAKVADLEIVEVYDFSYDIDTPIEIGPTTEDVVYVLQKNSTQRSQRRRGR
jgi:SAM-dependent methyltransferase